MYQAVMLIVAQLIPERWTNNNSQALVALLLSQTEITFVHIINSFLFKIIYQLLVSADLQWIFELIECNFLEDFVNKYVNMEIINTW